MEPILKSGRDILSISFSSALSGTYNSARIAKEELQEKYPERKIIVIDSLSASMGQGLLVYHAAKRKQEGKSIEEVAKWVEENKLKLCHLFTVDDLNHLRRGGRLSPISAILGTILRVKPLLHVSIEGKLTVVSKSRGRHTSLDMLVQQMEKTIENPEGQTVFISHGDCLEEAEYVKEKMLAKLPIKDVVINYVGPVIGSHSGPGTIAIFYFGNDRFTQKD
jgi:DegV family protein with EDD domain